MTMRINKFTGLAVAAALGAGLVSSLPAQASTVLTLGAEHTGVYILNYYLGGNDSLPSDGTGPDLGFGFSTNATVQKAGDSANTGDGRFENNPSGQSEILAFAADNSSGVLNTGGSYVNFGSGFSSVSFNYALSTNSSQFNGTADVWSGLNGTGTLLASIALNATGAGNSCIVGTDAYCNWTGVTASSFKGVAQSVTFGATGTSDFAEFDGLQVTPVPLPAAAWLLLSGAAGLAGFARRLRRA
jgi:hypothetical protein